MDCPPGLPPLVSDLPRQAGKLQKLMYGICLRDEDHQRMWKKLREERESRKDSYGGDDRAWLRWIKPDTVVVPPEHVYKLEASEYPRGEGTKLAIAWLWATGNNRNKGCATRAYDPSRIQSLKEFLCIDDPNYTLQWYWCCTLDQPEFPMPYPSPWIPGRPVFIDRGWQDKESPKYVMLFQEVRVVSSPYPLGNSHSPCRLLLQFHPFLTRSLINLPSTIRRTGRVCYPNLKTGTIYPRIESVHACQPLLVVTCILCSTRVSVFPCIPPSIPREYKLQCS